MFKKVKKIFKKYSELFKRIDELENLKPLYYVDNINGWVKVKVVDEIDDNVKIDYSCLLENYWRVNRLEWVCKDELVYPEIYSVSKMKEIENRKCGG